MFATHGRLVIAQVREATHGSRRCCRALGSQVSYFNTAVMWEPKLRLQAVLNASMQAAA